VSTHDFTGAPCLNNPTMWLSEDWADHLLARKGCGECPLTHLAACNQLLKEQQRDTTRLPTGTWAGQLFSERGHVTRPPIKGRPRKKREAA